MTEALLRFSPLWPFGVEVGKASVDINTVATKPGGADLLRAAIASHGVVVFREQWIDDQTFVSFLSRLGPLTFTAGETPVLHCPDLNIVSNVGRTTPPRSVFHTDTSYVAQPPAFTALRAVTLPATGGETLFSNQYHAYDTLPAPVKEKLTGAKVLHVASGVALDQEQERQSWHPLFQRHPIVGRTALFMSTPARCQAISGLPVETAQRVIRLLYRHSIRPSGLYRHAWQPGDLLIWDNRCTMHRADHAAVCGDRVLHRGLVLPSVSIAQTACNLST